MIRLFFTDQNDKHFDCKWGSESEFQRLYSFFTEYVDVRWETRGISEDEDYKAEKERNHLHPRDKT